MRFFFAIFFLLWGSNAFATLSHEPTAVLVTGDILAPGLTVESAEVVGLTDSGRLLTQGLASKNGQSVGFVALLDKDDQIQWLMSDGDVWPEGGVVEGVHASQLLFDGSFLVHGTSLRTNALPVIYRLNPAGQAAAVFDCENPSLNEAFCTEATTPEPTHDATGTVLLVANNSAWRRTNGVYHRVFDFQVGDALPLDVGTLVEGVSCAEEAPISGWTLDGRGGVAAVVYVRPGEGFGGPVIMREAIDGEFSVDIPYLEPQPSGIFRCGLRIYGVDLFGLVFAARFTGELESDERYYWALENRTEFLKLGGDFMGAVSGLYSVDPDLRIYDTIGARYGAVGRYDADRMISSVSVDVARGSVPANILTLDDGSKVLALGTRPGWNGGQILEEGQQIMVRASPWTVAQMRFTALTAGLYSGSVTSNHGLAFVISDAMTGKNAVMRVAPVAEIVVNSKRDLPTDHPGECATSDQVWDGRPECTVRAAFEAAATQEHTSIVAKLMRDNELYLATPLHVSTDVEFLGPMTLNAMESDAVVVQGGSLAMSETAMNSVSTCVNAEDAEFLRLSKVEMKKCIGFAVRSIRSGPVELISSAIDQSGFAVYVDGITPDGGPLLFVTNSELRSNNGGIYATGSITLQQAHVLYTKSAGVTMNGADADILTLKSPNPALNPFSRIDISDSDGPGVLTLRGKLIIEDVAIFHYNDGPGIDAMGPVEFLSPLPDSVRISGGYSPGRGCRSLDFVDHEPRFGTMSCGTSGIRLRTQQPTSIANISIGRMPGPGILAEGPLSLGSVQLSRITGPAVFSAYAGSEPAVKIGDDTIFEDIEGPVVQTTSGDVVVNGKIEFKRENGGFDVGGNIIFSPPERVKIREIEGTRCKFWVPQRERVVSKKCGFSPMISHATAGTNIFENVDFINNRGVAIWAQSTVELRHVAMVGNDGGVIASSPNEAIILHEDVRILGNQGPGLFATEGNIKALAPFRIERNEGAGIIVQNGDFVFENDSDTPAKIHHNAFGEACAPVGDQEFYPVYDRCIRAGLFVPNGSVSATGLDVTENVGDGIAADQVELSSSTVCGNSGAEIASRTEVLDDVDLCNKIIDRKSSNDDGCASTSGLLSPLVFLGLLGFRRRRRVKLPNNKRTSAPT